MQMRCAMRVGFLGDKRRSSDELERLGLCLHVLVTDEGCVIVSYKGRQGGHAQMMRREQKSTFTPPSPLGEHRQPFLSYNLPPRPQLARYL